MASIRIDGPSLRVELSAIDKLLSVHGSFTIPLSNVEGASLVKPPAFLSALKLIGTNAPWAKMAGSFLYHDEVVFCDYRGNEEAILAVDLREGGYRHLFVHVDAPDTPEAAANRIAAALGGA